MRAFGEDYPEAEVSVLYRGGEQLRIDGCLPVGDFLGGVVPDRHRLEGL